MAIISDLEPHQAVTQLIDAWCERRALGPLRVILGCYPFASGLTDEWGLLASGLKTIRAQHRGELTADELESVITLQQLAESVVYR